MKVVSVEQMRRIEAAADASGLSYDAMMQNAGRAIADRACELVSGLPDPRVTMLIGPGNNGGDGLVAGRLIAEQGDIQVRFYLLQRRKDEDVHFKAAQDAGLFIACAEDDRDHRVLRNMVGSADLVVDALFGIGIRLPLKAEAARVLRSVNQVLNELRATSPDRTSMMPAKPGRNPRAAVPYILAVDCPSGLDCDSGDIDKNAIPAHETITFIAAKPGLFCFPGAQAVGQLSIASIGVPDTLKEIKEVKWTVVDGAGIRALLPERPLDANKGTFGKALIVAGSANYMGAPALAAQAAYRVGVGLVTVGAPQSVVLTLAAKLSEPTWLWLPHDLGVISGQAAKIVLEEARSYRALLLGPGWGHEKTTGEMIQQLLDQSREASSSRARRPIGFMADQTAAGPDTSIQPLPPLVIDADGLNLLSEMENWWTLIPKDTVITPHPGEMARLARMETSDIQADRWGIASHKAAEWNVVLVLKGAHTLIAAPDGRVAVLPFKTDALAKAGTGDVLAGMIVGLLAQGLPPFDAAVCGGYLHGLAGQIAAESRPSRSVLAGDVLDALSEAIRRVETG